MGEERLELLARQHAVVIRVRAIEELIGTRPAGGTVATATSAALSVLLPLALPPTRRRAVLSAATSPAAARLRQRDAGQNRRHHHNQPDPGPFRSLHGCTPIVEVGR
jgi:hypothetical protein